MTTQPKTLWLADNADKAGVHAIAAELRRLYIINQELVEALYKCSEQLTRLGYSANHADAVLVKIERKEDMSKYTQGPWFQNGRYVESEDQIICEIYGGNREDARLIAAAPNLLEAAKMVIAWYEAEDDHSKADFYKRLAMCRESEDALRDAIAKAEGQL